MTHYRLMTNREIVLAADNLPNATPLERELATRVDELETVVEALEKKLVSAGVEE